MDLFNEFTSDEAYRGDKLKLARMAKGFSLEEVASAIGKTKQLVSKYEKGVKPTEDSLLVICEMLGIERDFLFLSRAYPVETESCHFRSLRSRTQTITKSVVAKAEILEELIRQLEMEIVLPDVSLMDSNDFDISKQDEIERLAESCRREWGLGLGPISSMVNLVENMGIVVSTVSGVDDRVDAFSVPHQRPFIIRNVAKKSICRFRFDLAHELGHLLMHDGLTTGDIVTEGQADRFASAFLMPRSSFSQEFLSVMRGSQFDWQRMIELKRRWKTSLRALIYRAFSLGVISKDKAKSGFVHLNTKGQTKNEWGDESIPVEIPSLLSNAISIFPYTEWKQLLSRIGMKESTICELFMLTHPDSRANVGRLRLVV